MDENNGKAFNVALFARPEWAHAPGHRRLSFYRDSACIRPQSLAIEEHIYSAQYAAFTSGLIWS